MRRIIVIRLGAYGDCLVVSPLLRFLKEKKNKEVFVLTQDRGMEVFKNNPFIDKLIYHEPDSIPPEKLGEYFEALKSSYECDELLDLCESIECKLVLHPSQPQYNWTKEERFKLCNKNYYDFTFELAGYPEEKGHLPEMYFTDEEEERNAEFRKDFLGSFIILWCLSGSALHKSYPYTAYVMHQILKKYPDVVFITVGDEKCQILETELNNERIIHKSGKWSFRETALMCKYASLVVSPDTGVLHASGCFDTPKIGLLNHTTRENITKYFKNDFSIEAKVSCAPCFRLIYDAHLQCPIDPITDTCWCSAFGIDADLLVERIEEVYDKVSSLQETNIG